MVVWRCMFLTSVASSVTVCGISPVAERVWVLIHSDHGPFLVCCWYRPPEPGDTSFVKAFCSEFREHSPAALGCIVVGDVNCHNIRWLRYSSRNSPEGAALYNACLELRLVQRVRSPTREGNLLDVVLSDVNSMACRVLPPVADHSVVEVAVKFSIPHCAKQGALCEILRRRIGQTLPSQLRCNICHSLTPAVRARAPNI